MAGGLETFARALRKISVVATTTAILRFRFRIFETLEAAVLGLAFWLLVIFVADAFGRYQITSLVAAVVVSFLVIGFFFLDSHYREFTWYASGKIGFTGLVTLGTFFLLRAVLAIFFPLVLSFIGKFDALISGTVAFIAFFSVYHLSQST